MHRDICCSSPQVLPPDTRIVLSETAFKSFHIPAEKYKSCAFLGLSEQVLAEDPLTSATVTLLECLVETWQGGCAQAGGEDGG